VWPQGSPESMPFDAPLLMTDVEVPYQGLPIELHQPATFRSVDRMFGEERHLLNVVPALSLRVSPDIAIVPLGGNRKKELTVSVENQSPTGGTSSIKLVVPQGWTVTPTMQTVKFDKKGEKAAVPFTITVPANAGDFTVQAVAQLGNQEFKRGYQTIA